MKFIKLTLITFVAFFVVITAISLLIPSHIRISKAINLKTGKDSVWALIKDTTKWDEWYPAFMTQRPAGIYIQPVKENDSEVTMQIQQVNRKNMINGWEIRTFPSSDTLVLQWYMDFQLNWYPWQKFSSLLYENTYGMMMQEGLHNIKRKVEK